MHFIHNRIFFHLSNFINFSLIVQYNKNVFRMKKFAKIFSHFVNFTLFIGIITNFDENKINANLENEVKSSEDYEGFIKLIENVDEDIHGQKYGMFDVKMKKVKELALRCIKLSEECDFALHAFCKNKIGKNYEPIRHIDRCISELVWHKFQPKLNERIEFGHKNEQQILPSFYDVPQDSLQLLEWILLPDEDLFVSQIHSVLNPAIYQLNKGKVAKMDILLEIFLTLPSAKFQQILEYYEEKYGKKLIEEIKKFESTSLMWLGEKEAAKMALEILIKRLENFEKQINDNSIQKIVKNIFDKCKKQKELMDKDDEEKMLEDGQIKEIYNVVKILLAKFKPENLEENIKFSKNWLKQCAFVSNHVFQNWREQRRFDEIGRMLIVANLLSPDSKIAYFREKFEESLENENFTQLNWLIASRKHFDLEQIFVNNEGKCLLQKIRNFFENSTNDGKKSKYYFDILNEILNLNLSEKHKENNDINAKCEKYSEFGVETIALKPGKLLKIMKEKRGGDSLEKENVSSRKNIKDIMSRHKNLDLAKQRKLLTTIGRVLLNSIRPWCEPSEKNWWEFWKLAGRKNAKQERKEKVSVVDSVEKELVEGFCLLLKEKSGNQQQKDLEQNPYDIIDWFLSILNSLKENPSKLRKFNSLLLAREWPKVQYVVHAFLNFVNIYDAVKNSPLGNILLKFVNPSRVGQLNVKDIDELNEWYSEHFEWKKFKTSSPENHEIGNIRTEIENLHRRPKRHFIIIIFPTTSMFLQYLQTCIIILLIYAAIVCPLGCLFASGNLLAACVEALIRVIFYMIEIALINACSNSRS